MGFFILFALLLVGILIGLTFLLYKVPKRFGYPRVGILLSSIFGLVVAYISILIIFEDQLFSKSDAQELLAEQNIQLSDNFELVNNESMTAIGDYYHTFTLKISAHDKERIMNQIRSSDNFIPHSQPKPLITELTDYYEGDKVTQNYETEEEFVRELFEPLGKGYAPTWRIIHLNKNKNELRFEDIDE